MMKMKIKAAFLVLVAAIVAFSFSGIQLKQNSPEGMKSPSDRLIGAVITTESLNTFDFEAYLQENIEDVMKNGGEVTAENKYQKRIYAEKVTRTEINDEGREITHEEYVFDIDGFWVFDAKIPSTEAAESYTVLCSEGGLSDVHTSIHHTDDELSSMELTATLYYAVNDSLTIYYLNPVYQQQDGAIYCVEGTGLSVSGAGIGSESTQTVSDKLTVTQDGEEIIYESTVRIKHVPVEIPQEVSFIFMDKENRAIDALTYPASQVPEKIPVAEGTEYIIISERNESGSSPCVVGTSEEYGEYLCHVKDGICEKRTVYFIR